MKLLFRISISLLLAYLIASMAFPAQEGERPGVQMIAGMNILAMLGYTGMCGLKSTRITRFWSFSKIWLAFVLLMLTYVALAVLKAPTDYASEELRTPLIAIYIVATTFTIYYGVVRGHLSEKMLSILILVLLIGALLDLHRAIMNPRIKQDLEIINTSSGYVFLMLVPLLMHRYSRQSFWVFAILLGLTAVTGKRGAIVVFLMLTMYYAFNLRTIGHPFKLSFKTGVAAALACVALLFFLNVAFDSLLFRFENIVDPRTGTIGSGRDLIWGTLFDYWLSSGFVVGLIGSGNYSTVGIEGHLAHNDYIQFLIDYGVLGLTLYLLFQLYFFRNISRIRLLDRFVYCLLVMCLIILVGRGLFAGTVRSDQIYWAISTGYLLGVATVRRLRFESNDRCMASGVPWPRASTFN